MGRRRRSADIAAAMSAKPSAAVGQTARSRIYFTIVSNNYLSYAITLLRSLAVADPSARRILVLADLNDGLHGIDLPGELLLASDLGIASFSDMVTRYSVMEFNTAVKPYVLLHLFETDPDAIHIYLDPDILVISRLEEVEQALNGGYDLALTPHITRSLEDGFQPDDLTIMKSGIWNLGFVAMRRAPDTEMLVRWWANRCLADCRVDIPGNIFTDQRWMDMAPAFVEHTFIIRHPGYNLAYWNLPHRPVEHRDGRYLVVGRPLVFAHFSGIVPDKPAVYSKHQTRFTAEQTGALAPLLAEYQQMLLANGWKTMSRSAYAYAKSTRGRRLIDPMRFYYRELFPQPPSAEALAAAGFGGCLADWMDEPDPAVATRGAPLLTRLSVQCWRMRQDLQRAFDIDRPEGRRDLSTWFRDTGVREFGVDDLSISAAARLVADALQPEAKPAPSPRIAWAPQRSAAPAEGRHGADAFLAEPVQASFPDGYATLPRQLALLWEGRPDLQGAFPMHVLADLTSFLMWGLIGGLAEGTIDAAVIAAAPDSFLTVLKPHGGASWPSHGLLQAAARSYDGFLGPVVSGGPPASEEDAARIVAFMLTRWPQLDALPPELLAPDLAWLNTDPEPLLPGPPLSRLIRLTHAGRPDLRQNFPLDTALGRSGLIGWYLIAGRFEYGLERLALGPDLLDWLRGSGAVGGQLQVPNLLRAIHAARADLRAWIDIATSAGAAALCEWFDLAGRHECQHLLKDINRPAVAASSSVSATRVPLLLTGFPGAPTGRGEDARMTARALAAAGLRFTAVDRGDLSGGRQDPPVEADIVISHFNAETALGDYVWMRRSGIQARWHIGYWAWELSEFPDEWMHAFGVYDEVWASTEFARAAFASRAPCAVHLMPMVVEVPPLPPGLDRASFRLPRNRFLFFTNFDFRSFVSRKNPEAAIRAFQLAFPRGNEPVALVVKTLHADHDVDGWHRLQAIAGQDRRILLINRVLLRGEIAALMAACDAYVSLHRSEGFGRGPAEAMLLGKPVIVTAYSGNMDFCRTDNACLVPARLVSVKPGEYLGATGQVWADPDPASAADHMRRLVEDRAFAEELGQRGAETIRELYGAEHVGRLYRARLQDLRGSVLRPAPTTARRPRRAPAAS